METIFEKPLDKQVAENTDHIATLEKTVGLQSGNAPTTATAKTFANSHTSTEFKWISVSIYWADLSASLDSRVFDASAWVGTGKFVIGGDTTTPVEITDRTTTGFKIKGNNNAVVYSVRGYY